MTPHLESLSAAAIAVVTGTASAVMQSQAPVHPVTPFIVPIVSAAVGGLVSFVALRTTVSTMKEDVADLKEDVKMLSRMVSRIEGRMEVDK